MSSIAKPRSTSNDVEPPQPMSSLKIRKPSSTDPDNTDDDYDNLITLHGVLSAFLLSIAISAQKDVSPGSMQYSTFLGAVAKEQSFRSFVHQTLNKTGYDWMAPVGVNKVLNVEYELLEGVLSRWGDRCGYNELTNKYTGLCTMPELVKDTKLLQVVAFVYSDWPQKYTELFLLEDPTAYSPSYNTWFAAATTAILTGGLISNVILALLFMYSKKRAGTSFKSIAIYVIWANYVGLVIAIAGLGYTSGYSFANNSPDAKEANAVNIFGQLFTYIPPFILVLPACMYGLSKEKERGVGGVCACVARNENEKRISSSTTRVANDDGIEMKSTFDNPMNSVGK